MKTGSLEPFLLVEVHGQRCALPLERVGETMRPLPLRALAGQLPFVCGVAVIRGTPMPVIEVASALGEAPPPPTRFVTLKVGDRRVALAVDRVHGLTELDPTTLTTLPPLLTGVNDQIVAALGTLDAELLVVFGSFRLIPEHVWSAIDAGDSA